MTDKELPEMPPVDQDELTGNEIAIASKLSGKDDEFGGYALFYVWAMRHGSKLTWEEVKELPFRVVKPVIAPESADPKE
jgi:hypothetical protein